MLTTASLVRAIAAIERDIGAIRDELNAADRRLGDGDTGMTVAQVVGSWTTVAPALPADVGTALLALGRETGRATGSSLGSVIAMALSAAGRNVRGKEALARGDLVSALSAATTVISERSGAAPGDKCILDSLLAIGRELAQAGDGADLLAVAATGGDAALAEFRGRESRLGRARMYGAQSVGPDDPGMLAGVRLIAAARRSTGTLARGGA